MGGERGCQQARAPRLPLEQAGDRAVRAFGFEREGLRKGHYLRDGVPVDAILMAIQLDNPS